MAWNNYLKDQRSSPYISMLEGYGKNYLDPRGSQNMMMRDTYMQAGRENAGQQYREGMKMGAAGMNPFANQQYRSSLRDNTESAYRGYQSSVMQNQQMGQSMLGMGMQARMQQAQMEQQQKQMDREYKQHERGQWMTLGGTLASGLIQPGGLLGKAMPDTGTSVNVKTGEGDLTVVSPVATTQKPAATQQYVTGVPDNQDGAATKPATDTIVRTPIKGDSPIGGKFSADSPLWKVKKRMLNDYLSKTWWKGQGAPDFYSDAFERFYMSGLSIDDFINAQGWKNPQTAVVFRDAHNYIDGGK